MAQANSSAGYTPPLPPLDPAFGQLPETPFSKASGNTPDTQQQHSIHFAPSPSRSPDLPSSESSSEPVNFERAHQTPMERISRTASTMATRLWRTFLILSAIVGITLFMLSCMAIILAFCSGFGAILVYTGNAVLRETGHPGYTDDQTAASVGATGGIMATACFGLFTSLLSEPRTTGAVIQSPPVLIQLSSSVVIGTLSGTIGSAVLLHKHVDLGGFDILHATRAGALGGAILTLATLVFVPVMVATFICIFPTMFIAFATCVQWLQDRYDEDWNRFRPVQLPPDDVETGPRPDRMSTEPPTYPDDLPAL
ncbi:hypothetical protein D9611_008620 [Ephemerocybe angulata]|uniref:Uncharacterized protein n=1 Tax=Ephemerocybe angulata TaxID=980116 RepID=A0A8H5AZA2_9AGAR|nr:hypothetical protein D9611_008620 [Tulosesus angulatus]